MHTNLKVLGVLGAKHTSNHTIVVAGHSEKAKGRDGIKCDVLVCRGARDTRPIYLTHTKDTKHTAHEPRQFMM